MPSTTVRVPDEVHTQLQELAGETGETLQGVLVKAVDAFRRAWILAESNAAFARLEAEGRQELADEYAQLEGTLGDGLGDA